MSKTLGAIRKGRVLLPLIVFWIFPSASLLAQPQHREEQVRIEGLEGLSCTAQLVEDPSWIRQTTGLMGFYRGGKCGAGVQCRQNCSVCAEGTGLGTNGCGRNACCCPAGDGIPDMGFQVGYTAVPQPGLRNMERSDPQSYRITCTFPSGFDPAVSVEAPSYTYAINLHGIPYCGDGYFNPPDEECEPNTPRAAPPSRAERIRGREGWADVFSPSTLREGPIECEGGDYCGDDCKCYESEIEAINRGAAGEVTCTIYLDAARFNCDSEYTSLAEKGEQRGIVLRTWSRHVETGETLFSLDQDTLDALVDQITQDTLRGFVSEGGADNICGAQAHVECLCGSAICASDIANLTVPCERCCPNGVPNVGEECDPVADRDRGCTEDCRLPCEAKGQGYVTSANDCPSDAPCCVPTDEEGCCECVAPKMECCGAEGTDFAELNQESSAGIFSSEGAAQSACHGNCYWHENAQVECPSGATLKAGVSLSESDCYCCACKNEPTPECTERRCGTEGEGMHFCCLPGDDSCPDILLQSPLQSGAELGDIEISVGGNCTVRCYEGVCPGQTGVSGPSCDDEPGVIASKIPCRK